LQVELTRERFEELVPRLGELFYVRPRRLRVFVDGHEASTANGSVPAEAEAGVGAGPVRG